MKQNIIIMALLATATQAMRMESAKTLDEIKEMFDDPEYGDTWKYVRTPGGSHREVGAERYVDGVQWEDDAPSGYREGVLLQQGKEAQGGPTVTILPGGGRRSNFKGTF